MSDYSPVASRTCHQLKLLRIRQSKFEHEKSAKEICHLSASSRLSPTKIEEPQPATMHPSPPPFIPSPNKTERSFNLDGTLPLLPELVRCEYTRALPPMDDSVDQKQRSPINKTVIVELGVVQGTSPSFTANPNHECSNVPSPAMESDSRDFFPSSATAPSPAMESDSRDFFPSSATAPSLAMESDSREFFPSSATAHSLAMESDSRDFFPSSATDPSPAMESDSRDYFPSSATAHLQQWNRTAGIFSRHHQLSPLPQLTLIYLGLCLCLRAH